MGRARRARDLDDGDLRAAERWLMDRPSPGDRLVALLYPNRYAAGMSNLGLHRLLELVTLEPGWSPVRVFDDEGGGPLRTLDLPRAPRDTDLVAVSISYEEDLLSLAPLLRRGGIPPWSRDRDERHPLVVVGGFAPTLNPAPVAGLADAVVLGPAELTLAPLLRRWGEVLGGRRPWTRADLPELLADLPGCWVPGSEPPGGRLVVPERAPRWGPAPPGGGLVEDRNAVAAPPRTRILTPHTEFARRFVVAVGDGCPHGCRFCAAAFARRPPRAYPAAALAAAVAEGLAVTDRIGLLGAAVSDLASLEDLARQVSEAGGDLSTSSLRIGRVAASGAALAALRSPTIAPESASERLRALINKPLTDAEILDTVAACAEAGAARIRMYLLVGLPTERDEDADAIVDLAARCRERAIAAGRGRGRSTRLVLSVNAFVPKPDTPLQWAAMERPAVIARRLERIRAGVGRLGGVQLRSGGARVALRQALLSLGGSETAELLDPPVDGPGWWRRLQGWHRHHGEFAFAERGADHAFPWDFVDRGVHRTSLWGEWRRARSGRTTPACDVLRCHACGACPERGVRR